MESLPVENTPAHHALLFKPFPYKGKKVYGLPVYSPCYRHWAAPFIHHSTHTHTQGTHKSSLRPSLGHPSQTTELEALCRNEEARHKDCVAHIHSYSEQMREKECGLMQGFMAALKETVKSLLALFDTVTSPKDIIPGGEWSYPHHTPHTHLHTPTPTPTHTPKVTKQM